MTVTLQFLGAARHVTGSKHLLIVNQRKVLFECGTVQGPRQMANKANRNLPEELRQLDAVVLSHAHIDHSGALPRLVKDGFDGPVYCTEATEGLLEIMLADSAHIQASDARYLARRGHDVEPIYDADDVQQTLRLVRGRPYYEQFEVCPEVRVEFLDAGHILGSAIVLIDVDDGGDRVRIAFTGDHGRRGMPILRDPDRIPDCDVLITESTYGDREHEPVPDLGASLAKVVDREIEDGGRIIVPAFSVGRTQHLVLALGQLIEQARIPRLPIWVDSPMSRRVTMVMARHPELYDAGTRAILEAGGSPFFFDGVRYVADVEESKSLNSVRSGVIIAASGMCEAGRILHHLGQSVGRREDTVLMVGFQAEGTLGRRLADGARKVRILGEEHRVRCAVRTMGGFSAHADHRELLAFTGHLSRSCRQVFVVHGEEHAALTHADRLRSHGFGEVHVPQYRQKFTILP